MSGMLGRASVTVPAPGTQAKVFVSAERSKRSCTVWSRAKDCLVEPTSVLDVRSPSPSSTLSSSVAASSESGVQGQSESGGAVAVSGRAYESSEGQLVDCTSLLEGGNGDGSAWSLESVENGGEAQGVGSWQANPGDVHRGWGRNVAVGDGNRRQQADETPSSINEVGPGLFSVDARAPVNSRFVQVSNMSPEKQGIRTGEGGIPRAECLHPVPAGWDLPARDALKKTMVKREIPGDETLEACVLLCRKREREDSLGEVVQRLCVGGPKIESGELLSDWTEFGHNSTADSSVVPPSAQLGDLDDIFSGSASASPSEFWLNENLPLAHLQARNYEVNEVPQDNAASLMNNSQSSAKVQLDLFEAVQAGLFKGGSNSGSGLLSSRVVASSNISPSIQVLPRSFTAPSPSLTAPLNQSPSRGGSAFPLPLQRHSFGVSTPRASAFLPEFLESKPTPPAPPFLNATFAPAPPHFASQVQLQGLNLPLPTSSRKVAENPQGPCLGFSRPEYDSLNVADFLDQKPWHLRAQDSNFPPKVSSAGSKWQLKPEPAWQPADQVGAGHTRGRHLSPHLSLPAEHGPMRQATTGPEHVGKQVRLEQLSLAERLLCAASEAAQLGDLISAQAILARLNQQSSPNGQQQQLLPAQRVALLFGEALSKRIAAASSSPSYPLQEPLLSNSALDLINKISAFKQFCEISPISQFSHFTANQAILDAMEGEDFVHVVDFELGFGGQWASFMQEVSQRSRGPPELKITTMGTDTLEMRLVKENLLQFANEVGMKLEVNVLPGQKLEGLKVVVANKSEKEAVAINFGFGMNRLASEFSFSMEDVSGFLQMVKGLCPKVVAVVDCECEFEGPSAYMEALQFYACVFESLEASTKLSADAVHDIESLVFGPKIADLVNGRWLRKGNSENGLPPWRILLQKVGFTSFPFSNAADNQASWLVKNPLNIGFNFLKQHATLLLAWYSKTLISTSAWV